jgi:hypothetical protein
MTEKEKPVLFTGPLLICMDCESFGTKQERGPIHSGANQHFVQQIFVENFELKKENVQKLRAEMVAKRRG